MTHTSSRREGNGDHYQHRHTISTSSAPARRALSAERLYIQAALFAGLSAGAAALAVSYVWCPIRSAYCADAHYKYLVPLLIPVTVWFAIANWVGWTYFRFA